MRYPKQILIFAAALLASSFVAHAQKGKGGGGNEHSDVHRDMSAIEADIRKLIDQNETFVRAAINRSEVLKKLNRDLSRADRDDKQNISNKIQELVHAERMESLQSQLNGIAIQRLNLEMQTLVRYDDHLIEGEGGRPGGRFPAPAPAPQVKSVTLLKEERDGQNRVMRLYEVVFTDGSRQRVESKEHVPPRR